MLISSFDNIILSTNMLLMFSSMTFNNAVIRTIVTLFSWSKFHKTKLSHTLINIHSLSWYWIRFGKSKTSSTGTIWRYYKLRTLTLSLILWSEAFIIYIFILSHLDFKTCMSEITRRSHNYYRLYWRPNWQRATHTCKSSVYRKQNSLLNDEWRRCQESEKELKIKNDEDEYTKTKFKSTRRSHEYKILILSQNTFLALDILEIDSEKKKSWRDKTNNLWFYNLRHDTCIKEETVVLSDAGECASCQKLISHLKVEEKTRVWTNRR